MMPPFIVFNAQGFLEELQRLNVGLKYRIRLHLVPSISKPKHFYLNVLKPGFELSGSYTKK